MAYASPIQTSVNSGELSPRMAARVDFERYRNGCSLARNIVLLPTGGFTRAPGSRYVAAIKDETKAGRLLPFKFSQTDAYIIEMTEGAARFYRRQARIAAPNIGATITNGAFASDIAGWTDASDAGASISHDATNQRLSLNPAGNALAVARQQVTTTTTGVEHVLYFKIEGDLGASALVYVGSSAGDDDLFEETRLGLGWHTVAFTPSASPFYVHFAGDLDNPAESVFIDEVSLLDDVPLELPHDYSEAEISGLTTRQTADVLYLLHPDIPTRKFERRAHRTWSLVTVVWEDGPYGEPNEGFDYISRQLIKNPDFEDGMTDWRDVGSSDYAIEWDASQRIVTLQDTSGTGIAAIEQTVTTGVAVSTEYVLHFRTLGAGYGTDLRVGTTSGGADVLAQASYVPGWHSVSITSAAATLYIRFSYAYQSPVLGAVGGCYLYRSNAHLMELSGTSGLVTCTATGHAPFASTDVGRLIRFAWPGKEPAYGVITAVASSSSVTIRLRRKAPYANVPTENWQFGKWSATTGYPATAALFQSRIVAGNSPLSPQVPEFTQTGDLENFRPDTFAAGVLQTEDDDALSYQIAGEEVNNITWMTGRRKLIIGTTGGQFVAESQGAAITATDVSITPHSDVPCASIPPIAIENAVIFIEASGRQVYDLGYQLDDDSFVSADLTILADHILKSPAREMVLQRRPYQTIWTRRADGRLAVLAYNRKQDIVGWTHRIMGGAFAGGPAVVESVCAIPGFDDAGQAAPSGERDEVWLIVKRTIDGATRRYVEVFEGYYEGPVRGDYNDEASWEAAVKTHMAGAFYVDCGVTYSGSPATTITGLSHLEGQTVSVLADGRVHAPCVVASGQITLEFAASKVQAGLRLGWQFESLKLPYGTQAGSGVTKQKSLPHTGLALLDAGPFRVGVVSYGSYPDEAGEGRIAWDMQDIDFQRDGLDLDEAIPLFTGEVFKGLDGPERRDVRLYLEGDSPLPFTCLALIPQMMSQEK